MRHMTTTWTKRFQALLMFDNITINGSPLFTNGDRIISRIFCWKEAITLKIAFQDHDHIASGHFYFQIKSENKKLRVTCTKKIRVVLKITHHDMKEIYVNVNIFIVTPNQNQAVCNMVMEKNIYLLKFNEKCFYNVSSLYISLVSLL